MKGCKIFFLCLIFFVLSVCGEAQSAGQIICQNALEPFPCDDGHLCINREKWCDKTEQCRDGSDEYYCEDDKWYSYNSCSETHFKCAKGKCIPIVARCDRFDDCGDFSDEKDCEKFLTEAESYIPESNETAVSEESTTASTTSIAPESRSITLTPGITTHTDETYYDRRYGETNNENRSTYLPPHYYGETNNENRSTYLPPHYYGETVYNGHNYNQNKNSYNNRGQIPDNIDNRGQFYPYPYNQDRQHHFTQAPDHGYQWRPTSTPIPQRRPREDYNPYRRNPQVYVPRDQHLYIPPRAVLYPPTSKPEYSSTIKIKHPELPPFHFSRNYTDQFKYNYEEVIEKAKEWILKQRDGSGSWGKDTPRALIALSLITNTFTTDIAENELMRKNLQTHLGIKILRNRTRTEEISTTRLAMYINALLATCQDPRDFFDIDLVQILESRKNYLKKDQEFVNPLVYLSLCLTNKTDVWQDPNYLKYLLLPTFPNEVKKDIHILATTALACYLQQDEHNDGLRETVKEAALNILDAKKSDGSFGNKYNTALATQALMSLNHLSSDWNPRPALDYIAQHQERDGSFGDMMATYYSVLALSGRSLLHLRNTKCDPRDTTTKSSPRDTGPKKRIFYTLKIGYPDSNSMASHLLVPEEANFFDVMRIAEEENPRFKFEYKITNGKLGVYSVSNIQNDAERGRFWNLYHLHNTDRTVDFNRRYTGDIRDLFPREGDEMVYWYLPMF